jgi:hypothetical protein
MVRQPHSLETRFDAEFHVGPVISAMIVSPPHLTGQPGEDDSTRIVLEPGGEDLVDPPANAVACSVEPDSTLIVGCAAPWDHAVL